MTRDQEIEAAIKKAAGWDGKNWPQWRSPSGLSYDRPKAVRMRMQNSGDVIETGWENVLRAVLMDVATLVT